MVLQASRQKCDAAAESLPSTALLEQPAAAAMKAELQVLLAEVKRLGLHQEHLKQEVNDMESCNAEAAVARPHKSANLRLNGCIMTECPGPVLTVPFGRQWEAGSSDWSEAAAETPVRNLISGAPSVRPSIHPSIHSSIHPSIHPSIHSSAQARNADIDMDSAEQEQTCCLSTRMLEPLGALRSRGSCCDA